MNCKICHNAINNEILEVKERQLNQGEVFHYLRCSRCGTLQLLEEITDISGYYAKAYPAFRTRESIHLTYAQRVRDKMIVSLLLNLNIPQNMRQPILDSKYEPLNCLVGTGIHRSDAILDVGCGAGNWLRSIREEGFTNLTGVDLFTDIPKDLTGWRFLKGDVYHKQLATYDCITLHHSFEHMPQPLSVLQRIAGLLKKDGLCIIRIPIMESLAWELYGTDWYQIDAPRHFYLYTIRALRYLCRRAGLQVTKIIYDSEPIQFYVSDSYQKTQDDLRTILKRLDKKRATHVSMTTEANDHQKGDQAIFYIRRRQIKQESTS